MREREMESEKGRERQREREREREREVDKGSAGDSTAFTQAWPEACWELRCAVCKLSRQHSCLLDHRAEQEVKHSAGREGGSG